MLHLFNPENDLALGAGCRHYTPPPRVSALHRAGGLMPAWWSGASDCILAPEATDSEAGWLEREYGLKTDLSPVGCPRPWGWSADARRQFLAAGMAAESLPSDEDVERMRFLSHRRTSVSILSALGRGDLAGCELKEVGEDIAMTCGDFFVKSPWSCSGRGVFSSRGLQTDVLRSRMAGIIRRQGSVMVEKEWEKVRDFAVLFVSDGVKAGFAGWSMFEAERRGAYTGNVVAPQDVLRGRIGCDIDISGLETVLSRLVAPYYKGPFGVDMMVYRDGGIEKVHPCIELNLRMTMGFVAMEVQNRLSLDRPALLGWEYGDVSAVPLLKPREGFALTLKGL
ncbi:MAG: hypothetical protein K2H05_06715 [Duncaniella sp.]|nr:hypothetical protein [Duncaniella sp.]